MLSIWRRGFRDTQSGREWTGERECLRHSFAFFHFQKPALIISYLGWDRFVIATICMSHQIFHPVRLWESARAHARALGLRKGSPTHCAYVIDSWCVCFFFILFIIAIFPRFVSASFFYVPPKSLKRIEFYFHRRYFALHCVIRTKSILFR